MSKFITAMAIGALALFPHFTSAEEMSTEEILAKIDGQVTERDRGDTRGAKIYDGGVQTETAVVPRQAAPVEEERVLIPAKISPALKLPKVSAKNKIDLIILFEFDSAFIRPSSRPQLTALCGALQSRDNLDFVVVGHTDASGSEYYNRQLSQKRADEVKRHLVQECGVARSRLRSVGAGEELLRSGYDPRDEQQRRVEIIIEDS